MKKIKPYDQLQAELLLTRQKIAHLERLIEEDVAEIKSSLDPLKLAGQGVKHMLSSEKDGVVSESISLTVDALIKRLLLRRSNWMFKLAVAFFLKNYAKNLLSRNAGNILEWIKMKLRTNGSIRSKEYYDRSTSHSDWES